MCVCLSRRDQLLPFALNISYTPRTVDQGGKQDFYVYAIHSHRVHSMSLTLEQIAGIILRPPAPIVMYLMVNDLS